MSILNSDKNSTGKVTLAALKSARLPCIPQLNPDNAACDQQGNHGLTTPLNLLESNSIIIIKDQNLKISDIFSPKAIPERMRGLRIIKNRDNSEIHYDFRQSYGNVCGCHTCRLKKPLVCTFTDTNTDMLILCDKNGHRLNQARLLEVKNYITAFAGTDILEKILLDERVLQR